jgi:hypothetical protein
MVKLENTRQNFTFNIFVVLTVPEPLRCEDGGGDNIRHTAPTPPHCQPHPRATGHFPGRYHPLGLTVLIHERKKPKKGIGNVD